MTDKQIQDDLCTEFVKKVLNGFNKDMGIDIELDNKAVNELLSDENSLASKIKRNFVRSVGIELL